MKQEKHNICYLCGKPCYGKTCRECYRKDAGRSLSKVYQNKKHRRINND